MARARTLSALPERDPAEIKFVQEMYIGMLVVTHYDTDEMVALARRLRAEGFENVHAYHALAVDGVITEREERL